MNFSHSGASFFVPDDLPADAALNRVTRLGIGAHPDDLEFMAFHGIAACHASEVDWFGGVTCTDGAGSVRTGVYASFDDEAMRAVRRREQDRAAQIGRYGVMIQLGHPSAAARSPCSAALHDDLLAILRAANPRVVYTHNLADKHETHVGVAVAVLQAIRALPPGERPGAVYGCEGWRGLDWLPDADKIVHDVSGHEALAAALNGTFDSQIAGGKRYDLGVAGRRSANATFLNPHAADQASAISFAMDLTPLAHDDSLDIVAYVDAFIESLRRDVTAKLRARLGR